jgi:hypothetical protein
MRSFSVFAIEINRRSTCLQSRKLKVKRKRWLSAVAAAAAAAAAAAVVAADGLHLFDVVAADGIHLFDLRDDAELALINLH